ncbi:hypothetical protein Pyn_18566 [Prunus yedoensis var. nudiflora]|uniref:Uncharacterized protein n=1 Tax=Prunus yedoensis var. nudiflora TaxID=2094558 RepID=A0A314YPI5_PRUYE|nr:hypothetical protein Pyn_18566 [Prunus yedoensis var. nudiflora]
MEVGNPKGHGDEGGANKTSWWKKVLDVEEAKKQVGLSGALETLCGQGFGAKLHNLLSCHWSSRSSPLLFISALLMVWYIGQLLVTRAPLAASISLWLSALLSAILEEWVFEILVLMGGGLMPNSEETTSLMATWLTPISLSLNIFSSVCVNTEAIAYIVIYGLSAAASTRVSNELGAGNPDKAKKAMCDS